MDPRQQDQTHSFFLVANDQWKARHNDEVAFSGYFRTYNLTLFSDFGEGLIRQSEFRYVKGRSWRYKAPSIQSGRYHEFSRPVIERQGRSFSLICIANGRMPQLWWTSINSGKSWVCESVPVGSNWMRTHLWYRLEGP